MDETRIWLLTHGEYSSYSVSAVFDDAHKKEGERLAHLTGGYLEGASVEGDDEQPYILNKFDVEEPPAGKGHFILTMSRNGDVTQVFEQSVLDEEGKRRQAHYQLDTAKNTKYVRKSYWRLHAWLYAEDEASAVKIVGELRTQILAGNKPEAGDL